MAATSSIEWTDSTVNFWWGCTAVGPGCENCYADTWAMRCGHDVFGLGVKRRKIAGAPKMICKMHDDADAFERKNGRRRRVFMSSMCDVFDKEVPWSWRDEALMYAERCDRLDIQLLTKRISNVEKGIPDAWRKNWPQNVGLMITVVNQQEADRDIPRLIKLKRRFNIPWIGLSVEPLLSAIDLRKYLKDIDWVIVGGETGAHARPMHLDWARSIRDQCKDAGVSFFFKQWGEWVYGMGRLRGRTTVLAHDGRIFENVEAALVEAVSTSVELNIKVMKRVGKQMSGRHLDGRTHDEFPLMKVPA
ncbi:DUF5131 family protein [Hoeflea poritis]|uniref:DUF5131 family protein n=1 Tax=Hoeflea poritis TaxID=2993659 RepID=A0ABT4VMP0_9HYPH|nr:DUF5131 family protein [Hoeflea poritis]MDA4845987.1 DUF5131 family protein [Hoeflea poritis]